MKPGSNIPPQVISGFVDEASAYLAILHRDTLALEAESGGGTLWIRDSGDSGRHCLNEMLRAAQALDRLVSALRFEDMRALAIRLETLLDEVRTHKRPLTPQIFEAGFRVYDILRGLVAAVADGTVVPPDIHAGLALLDRIDSDGDRVTAEGSDAAAEPPAEDSNATDAPFLPPSQGQPAFTGVLDDPELAALFLETTGEALDELNQGLNRLEQVPDDRNTLDQIFRCARSLKGASGTAGLDGLYHLTDRMETVLDRLRSMRLTLHEELVGSLYKAVDHLRAMIDAVQATGRCELPSGLAESLFARWLGDASAAPPTVSGPATRKSTDPGAERACVVTLAFGSNHRESAKLALLAYNTLRDICRVTGSEPDIESLDAGRTLDSVRFSIISDIPGEEIRRVVQALMPGEVVVESSAADGM